MAMRWFSHSARATSVSGRTPWPNRAKRYILNMPVEYRPCGQSKWIPAITANLSCTGALLEANGPAALRVGDELEVRLVLPPQLTGHATVPLLCVARVVRVEAASVGHARFGAAIQRYRLEAPTGDGASNPDLDSVRSVRHEVNNALTAIIGSAELLLLVNGLDELTRGQLQTVRDSALRAANALRRLRYVAA